MNEKIGEQQQQQEQQMTTGEQHDEEALNQSSELKKHSKTKHANKLLYKQMREQMEFYFSDSNLSKDRFINQEIVKSQDGYIDLDLFLKFNKIRTLTSEVHTLAKSLKRSTFLELNEEHTKVKRCVPYVEPNQNDVDKRTVYVERLPPHVDHVLLKTIFSRCGNVSYVSLPRYRSTKQIKGFAFVEFESKEGAKNAIKTLNDNGTDEDSENNENVGKFPKYNKQLASLEEKLCKTEAIKKEDEEEEKNEKKKRKLTLTNDSIELTNVEPLNKERKVEEENATEEKEPSTEIKKKKNRRRKNSVLKAKKMEKEIAEEATLLHLRVISKKEWLRLKKDYLQKQKSNLSELKAKLKSINEKPVNEMEVDVKVKNKSRQAKVEEKMNVNYEVDENYKNCIVKLTPKSTFDDKAYDLFKLSRQQFKNEKLKDFYEQVAYVDIDKNLNRVFVRCKNKEAAEGLLKLTTENLNEFNKNLLIGAEEYDYVNKISLNRDKKQEKKVKKEIRGKDKIINKANNAIKNEIMKEVTSSNSNSKIHIKFDE